MTTNPMHVVHSSARKWAASHPELEGRIYRAVALTGGVKKVARWTFTVDGESSTYYVRVNPRAKVSSCTCPDSRRGNKCKHVLAVALAWQSQCFELAQGA